MFSRRSFLSQFLVGLLIGCTPKKTIGGDKLVIGIVGYGEEKKSIEQYQRFKEHMSAMTNSIIELEPTFNEVKALEQIKRRAWSLVFAPPGLAAIAMSKEQYTPIFALQGPVNLHSVLVVRADSPVTKILDLQNRAVALGQVGSATGYYLPIYDLYGLTLSEIVFASTPKNVLELIENGTVAAGALSKVEFESLSRQIGKEKFRILSTSTQSVPSGLVLLAPTVERNQAELIVNVMKSASPTVINEAGYIPNVAIPDYTFLIKVVERVRPIVTRIKQKPAPLFEEIQK
ncbi:MAG: phosphonate ABC transporter substrate-binding protein [Pseudanabaena sp.]|nr:MAG: phosphonate ABC transporter substrate-binding protein [Pseudanabaena sp.]